MTQALNIGDQAPAFRLAKDGGGEASLKNYVGRKLVVYFYPKDDTPGCTTEALDFTAHLQDFTKANTDIVGVSADTVEKHDKFKAKHQLAITLLSDPDQAMLRAYDVWVEKNMYGRKYMGIERATYLIDEKSNIEQIWRKVKVKGHVEAVLAAAKDNLP